jgi:protein TonB
MPEYAGGMAAMNKFIYDNLKFPTEGLQQTGTCYASFVVNKDGTVSNIRIIRVSGCPACDKEVLRVLRLMPQNWTCGRQNNFPVRVQFNLPVRINVR